VSKKLPGIRLVSIELEVRREATAERAKAFQQIRPSGLARNAERARICDMNFDLVAFLQFKRFDHRRREAHGKTIAPFRDVHIENLIDIQ